MICMHISKPSLLDIDECMDTSLNNCDRDNGNCTNTEGSFNCSCNAGYSGDGVTCDSKSTIRCTLACAFKEMLNA